MSYLSAQANGHMSNVDEGLLAHDTLDTHRHLTLVSYGHY